MATRPPAQNQHQPPFARATQLMKLARMQIGCVYNADKLAPKEAAAPAPPKAPDEKKAAPFGMAPKVRPEEPRAELRAEPRAAAPSPVHVPAAAPVPAPPPAPVEAAGAAPEAVADGAMTPDGAVRADDDGLEGMSFSALENVAKSEGVQYKKGSSRAAVISLIRQKRGA